jgi:hypothetical protein
MKDSERFELLWFHYHKQIDENRAVHKSLNELRNRLSNLERRVKKKSRANQE